MITQPITIKHNKQTKTKKHYYTMFIADGLV